MLRLGPWLVTVLLIGLGLGSSAAPAHAAACCTAEDPTPSPVLALAPARLDWGNVAREPSGVVTKDALARNVGSANLTLTGCSVTTPEPALFGLAGGSDPDAYDCQHEEVLAPGAQIRVPVTFMPRALGVHTGTLTVISDGGSKAIALRAAVPPGRLEVAPSSLDFGLLPVSPTDRYANRSPVIKNTGGSPITLTGCGVAGDSEFTVSCPHDFVLGPGLSMVLEVTFSPSRRGTATATVTVTSDVGSATLEAQGRAGRGEVSVDTRRLDFGERLITHKDATRHPRRAVTITNTGEFAIPLTALSTSKEFSVAGGCPSSLAPGASCDVVVVFRPAASGERRGRLRILSSVKGAVVDLVGQGRRLVISDALGGFGHATVKLAVSGPGKVTARQARATSSRAAAAAKRRHLVRTATRKVRGAGRIRIGLRPTAAGRRYLARHGKLTVPVRVTFSPRTGRATSARTTVTMRRRPKR